MGEERMEYDAAYIGAFDVVPGVKSFRFARAPDYNYEAGQYLLAKISETLFHFFSISSSPTEEGFLQFTTRMTGSDYKNALDLLREGDHIKIGGPFGRFTYNPEYKKIAFLSGGIGITPIRSIMKYVSDKKIDTDIILLYGNKNEEGIAFRRDLDEITGGNKIKVVHVLSDPGPGWIGYRGYITKDIIKKEVQDYADRIFCVCGPPGMVSALIKTLDEMNIPQGNITLENFAGY
jgi:ferredoxin-NADP reductase